jgi:4-hydroxyphenylpyruvate dioxygenase
LKENQLGPVFFELIQDEGNQGFKEGHSMAPFESLELHQTHRGELEDWRQLDSPPPV